MIRKRKEKQAAQVEILGTALRAAFHEDLTAEAGIEDLIARLDALPMILSKPKGPTDETQAS